MAAFEKGHSGRPAGTKTRLTRQVIKDMFAVWCEPSADGVDVNRGTAALRQLFFERPAEFVRIIASVLPRDLVLESAFSEHDTDKLERMLVLIEQQVQAEQDDGDEIQGQDGGDGQGDGGGIGGVAQRH
jgi:hypothetical protein